MIYAGVHSFFGLGLEEGHVPTFWPLLYCRVLGRTRGVVPLGVLNPFYEPLGHVKAILGSCPCTLLRV